jgi:SM-20-related protein
VDIDAVLCADGVGVQDRFLDIGAIRALTASAELRRARGEFAAARIGGGREAQRREEIRGDFTCWIEPPLSAVEHTLLQELERVRLEFNRAAALGLFDIELHYARYAPGTGYARHVDRPLNHPQRQVSLVLYLNENWTPAAGGALRLFGAAGDHRDVEPLAGRLVCFQSAGREHAVLPTRRDRLSISGWFRARDGGCA